LKYGINADKKNSINLLIAPEGIEILLLLLLARILLKYLLIAPEGIEIRTK